MFTYTKIRLNVMRLFDFEKLMCLYHSYKWSSHRTLCDTMGCCHLGRYKVYHWKKRFHVFSECYTLRPWKVAQGFKLSRKRHVGSPMLNSTLNLV